MQPHKSTPGPRGLSCLTCRQRRKKCDKSRPACERCLTSGFSCLGYDGNHSGAEERRSGAQGRLEEISQKGHLSRTNPKPILPRPAESVAYTRQQPQQGDRIRKDTPSSSSLDTAGFGPPSLTETFPLREHLIQPTSEAALASYLDRPRNIAPVFDYDNTAPTYPAENSFNDLWPQNQSQSLTRLASPRQPSPVMRNVADRRDPETSNVIDRLGQIMKVLCRSIPCSVNSNASMREKYVTFIISQYELQRVRKFFQPPPTALIDSLVARLKQSGANLWLLYLGAKIFEQLNESPGNAVVRPFVHWINKCDQQITNTLDPICSAEELGNRLSGLLELVFLKFVAVNTRAGYSLLQRSLPVFLALVSTDSSLWTERQGLLLISVARALDSPRYEIRRFVFYDIMIAFALGTPPLIQYDTSDFPVIPAVVGPLEWVHGIPIELTVNVVQVNAWRASNPGIPNVNDWTDLELRALAWIPRAMELAGDDSYEVVTRLSVQETWRQAILIYVYMGMCCVDSHNPQVQYSVRQILQLLDVVSESPLDVHLFLPYLIAGVAARYENQRATIRAKLASFYDIRVWLLPGAEFTMVLDHLWHGVAAGGAPVRWDDYVCSRRTVLPVT